MTVLMQTYFNMRISFTNVAEDIMYVNYDIDWEKGDYISHVPLKYYHAVFYVGSFMNIDVSRYYRYMFWTSKHIYYGVTEGPPMLDILCYGAALNMKVIVPSQYVKWELENAKIRVDDVIPHSVILDEYDPKPWRKMFGDKFVVLYVAHRHRRKGFKQLMEAWRMTKASKDRNVLLFLHTVSEPNRISGEDYVDFSGNVVVSEQILKLNRKDLYGLYAASDIYVHPALCEGFGIPIAEAMYLKKPVICIDAPPMNEHVTDKNFLVKVEEQRIENERGIVSYRMNYPDIKDFAEKLDWLIYSGKEFLNDVGMRNAEIARKRYNPMNYRRFSVWL